MHIKGFPALLNYFIYWLNAHYILIIHISVQKLTLYIFNVEVILFFSGNIGILLSEQPIQGAEYLVFGAKYLVFVSSRSLRTKEKYVYFYIRKYFVKVNIDGYVLKKYINWDKLSCHSLYIFLSFWENERRQKPNTPQLSL